MPAVLRRTAAVCLLARSCGLVYRETAVQAARPEEPPPPPSLAARPQPPPPAAEAPREDPVPGTSIRVDSETPAATQGAIPGRSGAVKSTGKSKDSRPETAAGKVPDPDPPRAKAKSSMADGPPVDSERRTRPSSQAVDAEPPTPAAVPRPAPKPTQARGTRSPDDSVEAAIERALLEAGKMPRTPRATALPKKRRKARRGSEEAGDLSPAQPPQRPTPVPTRRVEHGQFVDPSRRPPRVAAQEQPQGKKPVAAQEPAEVADRDAAKVERPSLSARPAKPAVVEKTSEGTPQ